MSEIGGTMALATLKYFSALPKLHLFHNLPAKEMSFILISMGIILILGFFIDFVEISMRLKLMPPLPLLLLILLGWQCLKK
jgi:TRAP-type mannitol/chloroaromatic compound transport system permease large subunit